jgi:hypothetical protein
MPAKYLLHAAELALATVLAVALYFSWRADQRDRAQLTSELAATKQLLTAADARQHDRDTQLQKTLAALATKKRTVITPAQIVRDLPSVIPLPAPIALQTPPPTSSSPNATKPSAPGAVIPAQDLKPLYDFSLDCQACQAKLSAAQNDLADEQKKTAALTHERDDALRIAKGGSFLRRITRAAKWFAIGAAAGAIVAKAAH